MRAISIKLGNTAYIFHSITVANEAFNILLEKYAGEKHQLPKGYDLRYDTAHIPGCQEHLHIDRNGRFLGAFNVDGSPHDNSNFRIPKVVADFVSQNFPQFKIPKSRHIRALNQNESAILLRQAAIEKCNVFEFLFVIDLNEIETIDPDTKQLLESLLDYLN